MPATIVVCTHAKFSTIELCKCLKKAGFTVIFHPVDYSKEAKNLDKLLQLGITVVEDEKLLLSYIKKADVAIEDGARISKLIQKNDIAVKKNFFSVEQTSGGVRFLKEHPPQYPVIDVAMSAMKLDIENRRATPEGVIRYFSEATGSLLGGKEVFILGFGSIGQGIARLAQTLGAHVTVYDTFATKRMFARHHGYATVEKEDFNHILPKVDVLFMATNTYQGTAISAEQTLMMKDGATICNAGSGRGELCLSLQEPGNYAIHDANLQISEEDGHLVLNFTKGNLAKKITVLGRAFPINLHLGKGTSHDAIEVVMSLLLLAALQGPASPEPGLQPLDHDIQESVAYTYLTQHQSSRVFAPKHISTRGLEVNEKPYGGIFPFHNELSESANLSVARAWFKPNTKTRGHYHQRTQESYFAEKGSATILLWPLHNEQDVSTFFMQPGDYLIVPENYYHDVQVTSDEDFECLVIATPPFTVWDQFFNKKMEIA